MRNNRHKAAKRVAVPTALAAAAALVWAAIGLPGWASEPAATPGTSASSTASTRAPGAAVAPVACDREDDPKKGWYQPVYVHRSGKEPSGRAVESVRKIMWDVDQVFEASAKRFGQGDSRRLRFVQDKDCRIEVKSVAVDGLPTRPTFNQARKAAEAVINAELKKADRQTQERNKRTRRVFFLDTSAKGCGLAGGPAPKRRADMHTGWAAVSWGCATQPAVTHEMIHQLGVSHCDGKKDQGGDPICRGYDKTPRCNDIMAHQVLDCAKDEFAYFAPRPEAGSPLAKDPRTNAANSPYLIKDQPAPALSVRLVVERSGLCLAAAGGGGGIEQSSCDGGGRTWKRAIDKEGYFTLSLGDKGCLALPKAASGERARPAIVACKEGDSSQEWWMPSGRGTSAGQYQIVNRQTKQALQIEGGSRSEGADLVARARSGAAKVVMAPGA
ncbi:RICIN domain-containing protein [Streptomyces sp. NPDC029004]|uniref:RICIN domain-containing protein n=1 Tax=Streptomyces sp. NPDC029004 TaxID=3154490 RepID=UPI0033FC7541